MILFKTRVVKDPNIKLSLPKHSLVHFILLQSKPHCYGNCCYNDRCYRDKDQSVTKSVTHVISIWKERRVFEDESISKFNTILSEGLLLLYTILLYVNSLPPSLSLSFSLPLSPLSLSLSLSLSLLSPFSLIRQWTL